MWISKNEYDELKEKAKRLEREVKDLERDASYDKSKISDLNEQIRVLKGEKRKASALCEGCKYYITGIDEGAYSKIKYHECALNRTCKDFDEKDKTDMEQVIEFVEKLGKGN